MSTVNVNSIKNLNNNVTIDISTNNQITVDANNFSINADGDLGLGTDTPAVAIDAGAKTDGIALPKGTTAQRPTPTPGLMRWNTTTGSAELYNGVEWIEVVTDYIPSGSTILG